MFALSRTLSHFLEPKLESRYGHISRLIKSGYDDDSICMYLKARNILNFNEVYAMKNIWGLSINSPYMYTGIDVP